MKAALSNVNEKTGLVEKLKKSNKKIAKTR